jgi:hypothetical protein
MPPPPPATPDFAAVVLGYLNFSAGAHDPAAWRALDGLFAAAEPAGPQGIVERPDAAAVVAATLREKLAALEATAAAFRDATQARAALDLVFDGVLPEYRRFHRDLLAHQPPGALERPFFVMAAAEAVLASLAAGRDDAAAAIDRLDDYVGWRPVAVLENGRLSEPYPHERVRPLPLFIAGVGPAHGRYRDLVATALDILRSAPSQLVARADFDPEALEELAIDPRAFDFLHPAASRPNYLFGLWDPSRIDAQGRYRRMVVQQATLDGILSWPECAAEASGDPELDRQLRWEAAAVLAGVVLMASGLSGHGPGALQAGLPLADLLPRIAGYRDEFYRWLLGTLPAAHRPRLEDEARRLRQPFGGVRRHINAVLAGRRARQVESTSLAAVCARLGRQEAAERLAIAVPAASARLFARITGRVVAAQTALARGPADAAAAVAALDEARDLLLRAVDCGAAVDPWNILGLGGQFPLHEPGGESLPDPRVDDLVNAVESILDGCADAWRAAELAGEKATAVRAAATLERLAVWWDRFATTTVSGVPHVSGREISASAREVIDALERRRESAPAPPAPGFWRREVATFSSPRAHARAAAALLDEGDTDGAMGLLVHWASLLEGDAIGQTGPVWLAAAARCVELASADATAAGRAKVRRFLELVEANTSGIVDVIELAGAAGGPGRPGREAAAEEDEDAAGDEERLAAAYESMVWRDSTDDGVDGGMLDVDGPGSAAADGPGRLEDAAQLLAGTCRLFRDAVTTWCVSDRGGGTAPERAEIDSVVGWRHSFRRLRRGLVRAAMRVAAGDQEPPPGMPSQEFDRLRWQRDAAAERLVDAAVQVGETLWMLSARLHAVAGRTGGRGNVGRLFAALLAGDAAEARLTLEAVRDRLAGRPVLYVPLARGGRPDRIARARSRERLLERLAACLPRAGLVAETVGIVHLAKSLESLRPPGAASVSEFDRVFEAATTGLVERIVETARAGAPDGADGPEVTERILDGLALLVPRLLETWMTHARQLRLSVLERVRDDKAFAATREFVERYGAGLFTQHLLSPATLRGILRAGVRGHLERLVDRFAEGPDDEAVEGGDGRAAARQPTRLVEALVSGELPLGQAAGRLRLVLEAVAENHAEYRDWNSTTTQSDRGECLHMLLEFLRVKAEYDRIAWTLRPVNMAHRVLARRGATDAAEAWRGRLEDETRDTAAELVARLTEIEARFSIRLASVGDRVRRPFTAALEQDELEALVEPAVAELVTGEPAGAGARLEARAETFLGVASGSGVEVPDWLERLGAAVERALDRGQSGGFERRSRPAPGSLPEAVPWLAVPWDSLRAALAE